MSSSVWNYRDSALRFLAEDIRDGLTDYDDSSTVLGAPVCRRFLAGTMVVLADLVRELDHTFTGDRDPVEDERAWIDQAHARLVDAMTRPA